MLAVAGLGGGGVVTHFETAVKTGVPTKVVCHADHATPICTSAAGTTTRMKSGDGQLAGPKTFFPRTYSYT